MLDRPWLETPFVFQGFEVREPSEIDMLRKFCTVVYIDIDKGGLPAAQVRRLLEAQPVRKRSAPVAGRRKKRGPGKFLILLRKLLLRLGFHQQSVTIMSGNDERYSLQSTVRNEASHARIAYKKLADHHRQMVERAMIKSDVHFGALRRAVQPALESVLRNPNALAWTVFSRKRDSEKYNRAVGTAIWCLMFGRQLGFERQLLEDLAMGGMLLDIGSARIPPSIAATSGELSEEQHKLLKEHVELGVEVLDFSMGVRDNVTDMVRCHHERADGSGYPQGLRGNSIPVFGRIAAIADSYDAMTSDNPYSRPMAAYDAARALNDMRGNEFAAEVVEQFILTMGMFPVGSIVELNDGSIAVVLEQNPSNVLRPKVMVLLDEDHAPLAQRRILEMRDLPVDATQPNAVWILKGHEPGAFGVDPMQIFR